MSKTILSPSVTNVEELAPNSAAITIEPLANGYGQTLGNSLRRVLLSSIEGAAITAFKIDGVSHEFTTIPGVKEDVVEIMMNLKTVVLKCHSDEPVELTVKKKGGLLTAGDLSGNADVEVIDPEQLIATIDDPNAEINMTVVVETGRGYQSIEKSSDTDGSISPVDAFEQAAAILVGQYRALAGKAADAFDDDVMAGGGASSLLDMPIEELGLSARTTNALISNEIKTVNDLVSLTDEELDDLKGFGSKAKDEVKARVAELEF